MKMCPRCDRDRGAAPYVCYPCWEQLSLLQKRKFYALMKHGRGSSASAAREAAA